MDHAPLSAYFSHPWKTHLPLNLAVWERLCGKCHLLLDRPIQHIFEVRPPYFINRMESLLQRSDVFVACLPFGDPPTAAQAAKGGDWQLRCSPYVLFEIRMAERADLPRFIVYDPRTGFAPPRNPGPHARYVPGRLDEVSQRINEGANATLLMALEEWVSWVERMVSPSMERDLFRAGMLLGSSTASLRDPLSSAINVVGFDQPVDLAKPYGNDAELVQTLRTLRLLVVDVSDPSLLPIYQMAHALLVPCIRLHTDSARDEEGLPKILQGHRAGYQDDLLSMSDHDRLLEGLTLRAAAVVDDASPIVALDRGRYELQQRGFKRHLVFVSHDLKGSDRALVEEIVTAFREKGIDFWEYETANQAGEDWRANLEDALNAMTHFVAIESPTYDRSTMCVNEMKRAKERESADRIVILAFRLGERGSPAVELRNENRTHQSLPPSPSAAATLITNNVLREIRR